MPSIVKQYNAGRVGNTGSGVIFATLRKSHVPEGGWNDESFRGIAARRLVNDIANAKRITQARGMRMVASFLKEFFSRKIEALCGFAERMAPPDMKSMFHVGAHEQLWADAIKQVLGESADVEVVQAMKPAIQSVADETAQKTTILLGGEPANISKDAMLRRANNLASKVTRINDTTRTLLSNTINDGLQDGLTVSEMVARIRERVPQIASNRIPTIARTEMGRAADEGVKEGLRNSESITHVSVIGCEAIEPGIPTYHGIPTCNIKNVPIADIDLLEFHINHTGAIIPSAFREASGAAPKPLPAQGGAPTLPETPVGGERPAPKPIARPQLLDNNSEQGYAAAREALREANVHISPAVLDDFQNDFKISPIQMRGELMGGVEQELIKQSKITLSRYGEGEWRIVSKSDDDKFEMQRYINIAEKYVMHQYLVLPESAQGGGIAKQLLRNQLDIYDSIGITKIMLHANIDIGGYAWARYGFTPAAADWLALRIQLRKWAEEQAAAISPAISEELTKIFEDKDPRAIRKLAAIQHQINGQPLGKNFLLGKSWEGEIDLSDPESYAILKAYLSKK